VRVGTVTIGGTVKKGTAFDPAAIADAFFGLHKQAAGEPVEVMFRG
jgi:hypothetical protein